MRAKLEKAELTTLLPSDFDKAAEEMDAASNGAMVFGKHASGATMFSEEEAKIRFADVWRRRGQGTADGTGRLFEAPGQVPGHRRHHSPRCPALRPSRHRQDHAGKKLWPVKPASPSCPFPAVNLWTNSWEPVPKRCAPVSEGPGLSPHCIHRRDRCHRYQPGRNRPRRFRTDPAADGAGRL